MCSRFALTSSPKALKQQFNYLNPALFPPLERISPTDPIIIVRETTANKRELALVRWGLIPHWVKDPDNFPLLINARAETLMEKPSFRSALSHKRCLIPADAFYEWSGPKGNRQMHKIQDINDTPFAFAGLWEHWLGPDGSEFESAAIITVAANKDIMSIHDRMPAMINKIDFDTWLDVKNVRAKEAHNLLTPAPSGQLTIKNITTPKPKPNPRSNQGELF